MKINVRISNWLDRWEGFGRSFVSWFVRLKLELFVGIYIVIMKFGLIVS